MKQKMILLVMMFGFGLGVSSAETKNRPAKSYFDVQLDRIYYAFDNGRLTYRQKSALKNELFRIKEFKRKALYDRHFSKRERTALSRMKNDFEVYFTSLLRTPRSAYRGCETQPTPRRNYNYRYYKRR